MSNTLYDIHDLRQSYNAHPALVLTRLTIRAGTMLGVVGPNGSGKTTLLRILAFLATPRQGRIAFQGRPVETDHDRERLRREVTLLLQSPFLLKKRVFANVAQGLSMRGVTDRVEERVHEALDMVGLAPERFAKRNWRELSGGEAQRVALAARIVLHPKVLLLDEPTSSLDIESARRIQRAVLMLRERHSATVIVASHDHGWLSDVCDERLTLGT